MPMKNSKFIPGMGLDKTERYSSLNKLLIAPFNDNSAHLVVTPLSRVTLFMKYGGNFPVNEMSFDDIVYRSL